MPAISDFTKMRVVRRVAPLLAFFISLAVYWLTVDPGASYWDCPEYLLTALKLEVGHPPGNPGWALAHRFASCFFSDVAVQVKAVNMMSGLFTALAVMILCSVSVSVMRRIWCPSGSDRKWRAPAIGIAALAGSLCFAWSDSVWYSAVEAEVYAMSLFLTALTMWMSLKWAFARGSSSRARWLVCLAYVMGFSIGVHQLNLLALPAVAMVMAFASRRGRRVGFWRVAGAFLAGCAAVALTLKVLMSGSVALAVAADVFAVNTLGLPFWSGAIGAWAIVFVAVIIAALAAGRRFRNAGTSLWCVAAVMLGYSVYAVVPVRAWANPPVNEGNPSNAPRFADYLERRQYGGAPLFYGRTPFSKIMRLETVTVSADGDTVRDYSRNALKVTARDWRPMVAGGHVPERSGFLTDADRALNASFRSDSLKRGYVMAGFHTEPLYTPELNMFLPRIHSQAPDDFAAYGDWTGMDSASMVRVRISEAFDSVGNPVPRRDASGAVQEVYALRPTYLQSLAYLLGYQTGYMYFRYLLWNYMGRQNDVPSTGEIDHGNFITGITPVDDMMLGAESSLPPELGMGNEGRNAYFALPFIIGVLGIIWLFGKGSSGLSDVRMHRAAWVSLVLFFMTGLAIVLYLNQTPGEPRERDYSFLGSFWVFAFWIACGMLWLLRTAAGRFWLRVSASLVVCALPCLMLAQNYGDHDRSGRTATFDYASNLLESLEKDAVLFVDGDNYIFPLWFAQEAMGIRRDVTVVCTSYLACDWYVEQLMAPRSGRKPLPMLAKPGDVALGNYNLVRLPSAESDTMPALDALRSLYADMSPIASFPVRMLVMGRDSLSSCTFDLMDIPGKGPRSIAGLREVVMLDIVASNAASSSPRPVYWHQNLPKTKYCGFYPHTRQALYTRRLMPELPDTAVLTEEGLDALPKLRWGGLDRTPYPGPDVSAQAAQQRASLVRLAQSLASRGRHAQALHVARMAMVRFPQSQIPFTVKSHADSVYFEADALAGLLIKSGEAVGDTAAVALGKRIVASEERRSDSFRRYLQSLPSSRRSAVSPATRNLSVSTSSR